MSLLLTIIKSPNDNQLAETCMTFSEQGGSIGRNDDNTWVLPDPERYLSGCHCKVVCENGQYFLIDMSTNGTFINEALEPVGKGGRVQLKDGDQFSLGDFDFQVSLWGAEQIAANNSASDSSDPFVTNEIPPGDVSDALDSPFVANTGHILGDESLFGNESEELDPLAALDKANKTEDHELFQADNFAGSYADHSDAMKQAANWPGAAPEKGAIPDDWDDDLISPSPDLNHPPPASTHDSRQPDQLHHVEDKQLLLEKANEKMQFELEALKRQLASSQAQPQQSAEPGIAAPITIEKSQASSSYHSLIDSMGLAGKNLSEEQIQAISGVVGKVVRETVSGMMQVLSSRNSIKNEFRMNVTTIQPVENNPLKFSANVDDALENMFLKKGDAYKQPVEAVREGFEGIAEHQVAIIAGIRSAFSRILGRFDPEFMEKRFARQTKGSFIPGSQKAKNWESYCNYYQELIDDMDNTFQYLYGDEFVQAYEEQLQKLAISRKAHNNSRGK